MISNFSLNVMRNFDLSRENNRMSIRAHLCIYIWTLDNIAWQFLLQSCKFKTQLRNPRNMFWLLRQLHTYESMWYFFRNQHTFTISPSFSRGPIVLPFVRFFPPFVTLYSNEHFQWLCLEADFKSSISSIILYLCVVACEKTIYEM